MPSGKSTGVCPVAVCNRSFYPSSSFLLTERLQVCLLPDIRPNLKLRSNHHAEAQIVVAVAGAVVVPISHTAVLRIVVPAAAAIHAVRPRF